MHDKYYLQVTVNCFLFVCTTQFEHFVNMLERFKDVILKAVFRVWKNVLY